MSAAGPRVGILGGGQLGRMMALAGYPLGLRFRVFDPSVDACAGQLAEHFRHRFDESAALEKFSEGLSTATYEWENVPVEAARVVAERVPFFFPSIAALEMAQDRLTQKNFLRSAGVGTAPFEGVASPDELAAASGRIGYPAVLKTRRLGYDGKGQCVLRGPGELVDSWKAVGGAASVLEGFVRFDRELSIVAARSRSGEMAFYPLAENEHVQGILRVSKVIPGGALQTAAEQLARAILEKLDYVGVLTLELFEQGGKLLVNELATRVHNSGHWTMDGAETSQFENHLRAGLGLPLGSTAVTKSIAMVNLIGSVPEPAEVLKVPGARLHLYGKAPAKGRKLGHINVPLEQLERVLSIPGVR